MSHRRGETLTIIGITRGNMADEDEAAGGAEETDQPEGKYDAYVDRVLDVLDLFGLFS